MEVVEVSFSFIVLAQWTMAYTQGILQLIKICSGLSCPINSMLFSFFKIISQNHVNLAIFHSQLYIIQFNVICFPRSQRYI